MVASFKCRPVAHADSSFGVALSIAWTIDKSWKVALPAPPPPPVGDPPLLVTPHENDITSISSLCLASSDSPLMSPIFAKMSDAMVDAPEPLALYALDVEADPKVMAGLEAVDQTREFDRS